MNNNNNPITLVNRKNLILKKLSAYNSIAFLTSSTSLAIYNISNTTAILY